MKRALYAVALVAGCGGGGGKSDSAMTDAPASADAPSMMIDAPPPIMGLGQPCTPGATPQGHCPGGFECLSLNGGAGKWCSKTCTRGAGDMCAVGYLGPGLASCIFDIMDAAGTRQFCGVICNDTTGACPAAKCNNTCQAPLMCTANL